MRSCDAMRCPANNNSKLSSAYGVSLTEDRQLLCNFATDERFTFYILHVLLPFTCFTSGNPFVVNSAPMYVAVTGIISDSTVHGREVRGVKKMSLLLLGVNMCSNITQ